MMFRDQVGVLAGWFKGWNECEQTVALLSLLKRVSQTQARFLQLCLEHSLADCAELHVLEGEANSPGKCVAVAPREPRLPPPSRAPPPPASTPRGPHPYWPPGLWASTSDPVPLHLFCLLWGFAHCELLSPFRVVATVA